MKKKPAGKPKPPAIPIREIRGQRVLLDSDLATIYGVPALRLNEAGKRNRLRFPADFRFQLNREEAAALRSQNAILDPKASMPGSPAPNSSQIVMSSPEMEGMRSQIATTSLATPPP